jgi:microcystin-dependent protein
VSNPFVAEIRIFPFNFAPTGWAFCDGQILPLSQNTALFSLLGTTYGGDGKSNFALPNLQGASPMFYGQGPGLSLHDIGETGGETQVTLLESEIPSHSHSLQASARDANLNAPSPSNALGRTSPQKLYWQPSGAPQLQALSNSTIAPSGGDQPHNNLMPFLALNFCIALQGVYPPRT